jgi:hypothetical protein
VVVTKDQQALLQPVLVVTKVPKETKVQPAQPVTVDLKDQPVQRALLQPVLVETKDPRVLPEE